MRHHLMFLLLAWVLAACGSKDGGTSPADGGQDLALVEVTAQADVSAEADVAVADVPGGPMDVAGEVHVGEPFPPTEMPFAFTRKEKGVPIPEDEIAGFTREVTGLWKEIDYFRWLLRISTGVDASTGQEGYLAWYNDVQAVKEGDKVIFKQKGGDHNMWIPGSKILSEAINGCALTGDWTTCKVAEQYCKGMTASVKGFVWDDDDPAPFLMARAIFPHDNEATLDDESWGDDGRKKVMEFHEAYKEEYGWNAQSFAWPHNPTWGDIWITNMRSKDDVCAIVRTTTFLHFVIADAPFDWVVSACQETLDTMQGFNKDIVDFGYNIRTKDEEGNAFILEDQDLGNYVWYMDFGEDNECTHRLASDFIGYGEPLTNDCGNGFGSLYEELASSAHYYNYPIIWNYHMAALGQALVYGNDEIAWALLQGMVLRMDNYLAPNSPQPGASHGNWSKDMAVLLVQAAAVGLPLNADEARLVQKHWLQGVVEFSQWPDWDLWDESIPDGPHSHRPGASAEGVPIEAVALFLEYCNSPFRNPAGAEFVDCSVVADPFRWGE